LPAKYAVKAARKIRTELAIYGDDAQVFSSPAGPIQLAGLGARGSTPDLAMFEPETIAWIDRHVRRGDTLWDIGANVGIFAIYAAKAGAGKVYAFEPFAATYLQLQRNIIANALDRTVVALNLAISDRTSIGELTLTSFEPGVTSTLVGRELQNLRRSAPIGTQHVLTMRAEEFLQRIPESAPHHVKIDVDGAEALVLDGLMGLAPQLRSIQIEIEPSFRASFDRNYLTRLADAGLKETTPAIAGTGRNRLFVR
jgi:FkbM family methyltransferase